MTIFAKQAAEMAARFKSDSDDFDFCRAILLIRLLQNSRGYSIEELNSFLPKGLEVDHRWFMFHFKGLFEESRKEVEYHDQLGCVGIQDVSRYKIK